MNDIFGIGAIAVLLVIAALSAMSEAVITRVSRVKAHQLVQERQSRSAEKLVAILEDPARFLNVVMLITLAAHVGGTAIATVLAIDAFESGGPALAAVIMTSAIFVLAEVVPRTFVVQRTDLAALLVAPLVYWLGRLLGPLGKAMITLANAFMILLPGKGLPKGPFVTEGEIRALVDVAEQEEEIEEEERELIHSVFEFGDTVVREVMVPRPDMVAIPSDATPDEALDTIVKKGFSRIPVYEEAIDNIVGVLYAKDFLKRFVVPRKTSARKKPTAAKRVVKIQTLARAPMFVPEQKKVAELLREMQQQRIHIAIVVDEYGGTAGLVTIEDLVEEIVGEIVDEYDREEPMVESLDESRIRVDARVPIDKINDLLSAELPDDEWDSVGGLVFGLIGRVPAEGETVRYDSLEFTTEQVSGRRIQKVLITKVPAAQETKS